MEGPDLSQYVTDHIDEAISKQYIKVYLQPIVRTLTGEVAHFEALARWDDPRYGLLSPAVFIPALEESRQIDQVDCEVVRQCADHMAKRIREGKAVSPVSINLSRLDFELCDIFGYIEETLEKYHLPRELFDIEITESVFASDREFLLSRIDQFKQAGYSLWMDDFGSHYSSLTFLDDFKPDLLKFDMAFLRSFSRTSKEIMRSSTAMAKHLGMKTLAEGVETKEQIDFCKEIGIDFLQGFYYSQPRPYSELEKKLKKELKREDRAWSHFYDMADRQVVITDRSLGVLEFDEEAFHILYLNNRFKETAAVMHFSNTEEAEKRLNIIRSKAVDHFYKYVFKMIEYGGKQTYYFSYHGNYMRVNGKIAISQDHHHILSLSLVNITSDRDMKESHQMDTRLRDITNIFDDIYIINVTKRSGEAIYTSIDYPDQYRKITLDEEIIKRIGSSFVMREDVQRFNDFFEWDSLINRLNKENGQLMSIFRIRDQHGAYHLKEIDMMLIPESKDQEVLMTIRHLPSISDDIVQFIGKEELKKHLPETQRKIYLDSVLWRSATNQTQVMLFWKDRQRRFVGATTSFLNYYGFSSIDEIKGKTDEDIGWHTDNTPYKDVEEAVIKEGKLVSDEPGTCIIKGVLHHIKATKFPVYDNGKIIGLAGHFVDCSGQSKDEQIDLIDPLTELMNASGLMNALLEFSSSNDMGHYGIILLKDLQFKYDYHTYGRTFTVSLLKKMAQVLVKETANEYVIGRIQDALFGIAGYFKDEKQIHAVTEALAQTLEAIHYLDDHRAVTVRIQRKTVKNLFDAVNFEDLYRDLL